MSGLPLVAVTGAGGFLGGRVLADLRDGGRLDPVALLRRPVPWVQAAGAWRSAGAPSALDGVDSVVHLAGPNEVAMAGHPKAAEVVVRLASELAAACVERRVQRVVYVSTIHVYGDAMRPGLVIDETVPPRPQSPYAAARLRVEEVLSELEDHGVGVVNLRVTNCVGAPADPRVDRWTIVVNDLCRQAVTQGRVVLRSAGTQWRDFVGLGDVCGVISLAADPLSALHGTYNVGSGKPVTVLDVADLVADVGRWRGLGALRVEAPPAGGTEPAAPIVDISRIQAAGADLGTPLVDAVDEVMAFCITHAAALPRS